MDMIRAVLDRDLVLGTTVGAAGAGPEIPAALAQLPLGALRFDGAAIVAAAGGPWAIDPRGRKRVPALADSDWPVLDCDFADPLVRDDGAWRIRTAADDLADARAEAALSRADFARACAEADVITWAEARAWTTGQALPALAQSLVDAAPEAEREPMNFRLLTVPVVRRTAPEIVALAGSLGLGEAQVDALFGLEPQTP